MVVVVVIINVVVVVVVVVLTVVAWWWCQLFLDISANNMFAPQSSVVLDQIRISLV